MWATFSGRSHDLRRKHPDNIPMDARVDRSGKCLQYEGDRWIFITYERSPVQLRLSLLKPSLSGVMLCTCQTHMTHICYHCYILVSADRHSEHHTAVSANRQSASIWLGCWEIHARVGHLPHPQHHCGSCVAPYCLGAKCWTGSVCWGYIVRMRTFVIVNQIFLYYNTSLQKDTVYHKLVNYN